MEYLQSDEEDGEKKNSAHSAACRSRLQEQRERMHGALALIELANLDVAPLQQQIGADSAHIQNVLPGGT